MTTLILPIIFWVFVIGTSVAFFVVGIYDVVVSSRVHDRQLRLQSLTTKIRVIRLLSFMTLAIGLMEPPIAHALLFLHSWSVSRNGDWWKMVIPSMLMDYLIFWSFALIPFTIGQILIRIYRREQLTI
jgi:hypothetical protein